MPKLLAGSVLLLATIAAQGATVAISDNDNALLSLSGSNYNRLLVPHDKIMEAVFPPRPWRFAGMSRMAQSTCS